MDSPLSTWTPASPVLREVPFLTQVNLRSGTPAAFEPVLGVSPPTVPGAVAAAADLAVLWLGPDEWLVVGPPSAPVAERLAEAAKGEFASIVDVSAHRTAIDVTGPRAWDLLAHGCALDGVAPGHCAQTLLARAGVILWGLEDGYRVLVRSSFARYLAAWLDDASVEY
jgi:sarcosine oxidase subunit gamma